MLPLNGSIHYFTLHITSFRPIFKMLIQHINEYLLKGEEITRPTHRRTDANLYPPERQLLKASEPSFHLEGGAKGQI